MCLRDRESRSRVTFYFRSILRFLESLQRFFRNLYVGHVRAKASEWMETFKFCSTVAARGGQASQSC